MAQLLKVCICLAVLMPLMAFAQDPGIQDSVIICIDSIVPGDTAVIPIIIANDEDAGSFNIPIGYDPNILTYDGFQIFGALIEWDDISVHNRYPIPKVTLAGWSDIGGDPNPPLNTGGVQQIVAELRFIVNPSARQGFSQLWITNDPFFEGIGMGDDSLGNEWIPAYINGGVRILDRPPVIEPILSQSLNEGELLTIRIMSMDPDDDIIALTAENLPVNSSFIDSADGIGLFAFQPNFSQQGDYQVRFIARSNALADTEVVNITVINTDGSPVISHILPQTVYENGRLDFRATCSDPDNDIITLYARNLPLNASFTDSSGGIGGFTFSPDYSQQGIYQVKLIANSNLLADTEVVSITVINVDRHPVIYPMISQSVNEGGRLDIRIVSTDPDNDAITLTAQDLPQNSSFYDSTYGIGRFTFMPNYFQQGTYEVKFIARSNALADTEIVDITVINADGPPMITPVPPQVVAERQHLSLRITASDPDADAIILSAENLPANSSFFDSTGGIGGLVFNPDTTQTGEFQITIIASSTSLIDSEVINITVPHYDWFLANGDFEDWSEDGTNGPPDFWLYTTDHITASRSESVVHGGLYSAKIQWDSTGSLKLQSDPVRVIPGQIYTCSLWVSDNDPAGRMRPWFVFSPTGSSGPADYSVDSAGWRLYVFSMMAPPFAENLTLQLRFYSNNSGQYSGWDGDATIYVDDVVLWGSLPVNNLPPEIAAISRLPYPDVDPLDVVSIQATISDPDGSIAKDSLYYRVWPGSFSSVIHDSNSIGNSYWYTISPHAFADSIEYYIAATDNGGSRIQSATLNYRVQSLPGSISGFVSKQGNGPLNGVTISALRGDSLVGIEASGNDGGYTFGHLKEGNYRLSFLKSGYRDTTLYDIVVIAGSTQTLNVAMIPLHPEIQFSPTAFFKQTTQGQSISDTLHITNTGIDPLVFSIETQTDDGLRRLKQSGVVPQITSRIPAGFYSLDETKPLADKEPSNPPIILNQGGPDGNGYRWIDSNEPGGPAYDWIDITGQGTSISLTDDSYLGPIDLGMSFEFYGNIYTSVYINSNGFLSFGAGSTAYSNRNIPTASLPNNYIAAMWDDLHPGRGGSIYYYSDPTSGKFIVSFIQVPLYSGGGAMTFQTILNRNGRITCQYNYLDPGTGSLASSTVGLENSSGTDGLQICYNAPYLHNSLTLQFYQESHWLWSDLAGGIIAPSSDTFAIITMETAHLTDSVYTGRVVLSSNDISRPDAEVPVTVVVGSASATDLEFSPLSIAENAEFGQIINRDIEIWNRGNSVLTISLLAIESVPILKTVTPISPAANNLRVAAKNSGKGDNSLLLNTWLNLAFSDTTIAPGQHILVSTSIGSVTLPVGIYTGNIIITSNDPDTPIDSLPVSLSVCSAGYLGGFYGIVSDFSSNPIEGVCINVIGTDHFDYTDQFGGYSITNLAPGTYVVTFSHPSYRDSSISNIMIQQNSFTQLNMVLSGSGIINGTVKNSEQQPVSGARVALVGTNYRCFTDSLGWFSMIDINAGQYSLQVYHPDYQEDERNVSVNPDYPLTLNITLQRLGVITGVVTRSNGTTPLSGVFVRAMIDSVEQSRAFTESDGEYVLRRLPAGEYDVEFSKADFLSKLVENVEVVLEETTWVSRSLLHNRGTINLNVTDIYGHPLAGVHVVPISTSFNGYTDSIGQLSFDSLPEGIYDLSFTKPGFDDTIYSGIHVYAEQSTTINVELTPQPIDLSVNLYSGGLFRSGFNAYYQCNYINEGTNDAENVELTLTLPPQVTYLSSYPPGNLSNGIITWSWSSLGSNSSGSVHVNFNIPPSVPGGTYITAQANIATLSEDDDLTNNSASITNMIVNSWDPNDKTASPVGVTSEFFIRPDEPIVYTIQFENDEDATGEAVNIIVSDTLDYDLNWDSFQFGPVSHPQVCSTYFDRGTGILTWTFNNVWLPPNLNPPEGEGFVTYSIRPYQSLSNGTKITNRAAIKFDFNEWVLCPEAGPLLRTIDNYSPSSSVNPLLPSINTEQFLIGWSANDPMGSGIKQVDIYLSVNNGPYYRMGSFPSNQTETSFRGDYDKCYSFYSIAIDSVGHIEEPPIIYDATTCLQRPCQYITGDINSSGSVIASDITFGVRYLKGFGSPPRDSCYNDSIGTPTHWLYVAADVNNDCMFRASDITRLVSYFKGISPLQNCHLFPPPPSLLANPEELAPLMIDNSVQQPAIVPAPIQVEPGTISDPAKEIEQSVMPVKGNSKSVEKSPLRKK